MGILLAIDPELHQPIMTVFHNGDQYNTAYGNWFYRDRAGHMKGPFMSQLTASLDLAGGLKNAATQMREPFESDTLWWWWKDLPEGPAVAGPYETRGEAITAIAVHIQQLKDKAGHDQYR